MNNHLLEVTPPDMLALEDGISVLALGDLSSTGILNELRDFRKQNVYNVACGVLLCATRHSQ